MTRSIFVATLALTPSLLFAQASTPAQTGAQAVLTAHATAPADIKSANSKSESKTSSVRVSSGIIAPRMLSPISLTALSGTHNHLLANDVTVVVSLLVDPSGKTGEIAISQSGGEDVDKQVIEAVREARFQPGTLDGQPFAIPVRLEVVVQRGVQY